MVQKAIIDIWLAVIHQRKQARIEVDHNVVLIYVMDDEYSVHLDSIEEIDIYKLDHMSFDTLVLRITTNINMFEIPYYIEFQDYVKEGNEYLIPKFKIKPVIKGFIELITWLKEGLVTFNLNWIDENKPIIDNCNNVQNYKRNIAYNN